MQTFLQNCLFLIAIMLLIGCSNGSRPELVPVNGRITLDGQPLSAALVVFRPEAGGRSSRSITSSDGNYELTYLRNLKGGQPGRNTVSITTAVEGQPNERVPRKYNKESILVVDLPAQNDTLNFELVSK